MAATVPMIPMANTTATPNFFFVDDKLSFQIALCGMTMMARSVAALKAAAAGPFQLVQV